MEVKPGYQLTDAGVIPDDWESISLIKLCLPGGLVRGPFGGSLKKEFFVRDGYKVYEQRNAIYQNAEIGSYFIDQNKYNELQRFKVLTDDFIVSCSGTIGRIYRIPRNAKVGVINQALLKIRLDNNVVNSDYFYNTFAWDKFQQKIIDSTQGGAMQNLVGMEVFKNTPLALPPSNEQQAIAVALSDINNLIATQDKLIAKKRDLKQAAMQELLTGKRRLPGFSGKWEVKRLGIIVNIEKGQLITEATISSGAVPVIAGGKRPAYFHNKANRIGKTITISGSGANAGYVSFYNEPIFASDCSTISEEKTYSIEFIYSQMLLKQGAIYKAQTGGAQPHIHPVDLKPLEIDMPPTLQEQDAVAAVLSDMDAEIAALERKQATTRALKQGMMQELLTGRTRLV